MKKLFFTVVDQGAVEFTQTEVLDLRGSIASGVLAFNLQCKKYNWYYFDVGYVGQSLEDCPMLALNFGEPFKTKNTKSTIIEFKNLPGWEFHSSVSGVLIPITLVKGN